MQVIGSRAVDHVVTGVTVKLAKRDFVKLFATVVAAELFVHWPATKRWQKRFNEKVFNDREEARNA